MTLRQALVVKALIVLCAPVLIPSPAFAGRVMDIWIYRDGKPLLSGGGGDDGSAPPAVVWRYLTIRELQPADGVEIPLDSSNPLKATLRGEITVDVQYGGKAGVTELRLVRRAIDAGWTVEPDQVEQMATGIGLGEVPVMTPSPRTSATEARQTVPPSVGISWLWIAGSAVGILLLTGAVLLLRDRKGADRA